jgi:tRNA threonylcarbamoyladenosine biosynthesis protein TsaB
MSPCPISETFGPKANVLAIETAFPQISMTLWSAGELLVPKTDLGTKRAASLHEALRELLETAKLEAEDLEHVLIDQGPGSYTGLRVGLALAQTMEFSVQTKVHALYSTDILAGMAAVETKPDEAFAVALDARRQHWSFALYRKDSLGLQRFAAPRCLPIPELKKVFADQAFVASPHTSIPGTSKVRLLPVPRAKDLLGVLPLLRQVSQVQPIYLMPPL